MAISPEQFTAIREVSVPRNTREVALRLYWVKQEIEALERESLALKHRLSRENDRTIVRGEDDFYLMIETCGSTAKVTRCHRGD